MADKLTTTPEGATEHLNPILTEDRLAFRAALDHLENALRADWIVFQHRSDLESPEGMERGHAAASAWDAFLTALQTFNDVAESDDDLSAAARLLSKIAPLQMPDTFDLAEVSFALLQLSKKNKIARPMMSELLFEACALAEACKGNIEFASIPRAA